jgi:N-acetylglutamate synthase-like GNAT family acetyltransferase
LNLNRYSSADAPALREFTQSLPDEDLNFLKENLADPEVLQRWVDEVGVDRFVAWEDDRVVGYVALHPLGGWSRHVAELRLVVAPQARAHGLGQGLVRQALMAAMEVGIQKVIVEAIADHDGTIGMLQAQGFTPEALLIDQARDRGGELRDLMVLSCQTDELARDLSVVGVEEAIEVT